MKPSKSNSDVPLADAAPSTNGEINRVAESKPGYDPFDPANLRLDQSFLNRGATKKLLTTVPVKKPGKQDFIRVHPNAEYRLPVALIELREERETYLILPGFAHELDENDFFTATIHLAINRQKVLFLWPVRLPSPTGRVSLWHVSAAEAAERAMKGWVRIAANMNLGAYEIFEAAGTYSDPEWPDMSMSELLRIGFKQFLIEGPEHPVIKRLQGLV
jgi:hypothetical protein